MHNIAQNGDKALDEVFKKCYRGKFTAQEGYQELLRLGYDEDQAYEKIAALKLHLDYEMGGNT
ncbi:MAG: hypothetical protein IH932_01285 [Thaumarchaeota archaeon]|nr:hypothetical protein [Nitrososphaerota archaeon]